MMLPSRVLTCADCGTRVKVPVDGADFNGDNPFYCLDCFKVRFQRGQL